METKKIIIFYSLLLGTSSCFIADIHTHTDMHSLGQIEKKATDQLSVFFKTGSILPSIAINTFTLERTTMVQDHIVNHLGKFTKQQIFEDKTIFPYKFVALSQIHLVIRLYF